MTPYEDLLRDLGSKMGITLKPDTHDSCRLEFQDGIWVQIDLEGYGDEILIGSTLGTLSPGPYRDRIFKQALRVNGLARIPRGILSFNEKNESLMLHQFFSLAELSGETLYLALQLIVEHIRIWHEALQANDIPAFEEDIQSGSGFLGLRQ